MPEKGGKNNPKELGSPLDAIVPVTVKRPRQEASGGAAASAEEIVSPTGAGASRRGQGRLGGASPPTVFKTPRPARPLAESSVGAGFFKHRSETEEAAKIDQLRRKNLNGIIKSGGASKAAAVASGGDASGRRRGASEASRAETPAPSNTQAAPSGIAAAQASPAAGVPPGFVSIRVGGIVFEASEDTLLLIPGSKFETLLGERWHGRGAGAAAKKQVTQMISPSSHSKPD